MRYLGLTSPARKALWAQLEAMPGFVAARCGTFSAEEARRPAPGQGFSAVEQCWHLADLEREGYGERIRRLRSEKDPVLPDFDGARVARERNYRSRSLSEGLAAFREARAANLALLRSLRGPDWAATGQQEGVGPVALCDIPLMMAEHDAGHREEILALPGVRP